MTEDTTVPNPDTVPDPDTVPNSDTVPHLDPNSEPGDPQAAHGVAGVIVKLKPDLKRAIPAVLVAMICFAVGANLGGIGRKSDGQFNLFGKTFTVPSGWVTVIVLGLTVLFVIAGLIASRSISRELDRVSRSRAGIAAGSAIRLIVVIVGYLTVFLGVLALLQVDLGNLLVGGAVTGVVVGIAAQQTLGNFFAGLVLLFARPYVPGERVKVHSGGMGGPFIGVIVGADLMYTIIRTDDGLVSMPNSGLLGAAIGPAPREESEPPVIDSEPSDAAR